MNHPVTNAINITIKGIAFVEFVADKPDQFATILSSMGFYRAAVTADQRKTLFKQGNIHYIVNSDPTGNAGAYQQIHRNGVSGVAFRVDDASLAFQLSLKRQSSPATLVDYSCPALQGIGGSNIYLVDDRLLYDIFSEFEPTNEAATDVEMGLTEIDHLTHNVNRGTMSSWEKFYSDVFQFNRIKTFNIKGAKTGLRSVALADPTGQVKIPINESSDDHSQIEEFLRLNKGEGIQHIAMTTDNIYLTTERLKAAGIPFQETPATYYELLDKRLPGHGEDTRTLKKIGILLDADNSEQGKKLLQIFTREVLGPMFFEIIQRKGNAGFGEGNFQALFESIELDQIRRGVV